MTNRDIAPDFRRFIRKLPVVSLEAMRRHLQERGPHEKAIEAAILELNTELLRRKWGGQPRRKGRL